MHKLKIIFCVLFSLILFVGFSFESSALQKLTADERFVDAVSDDEWKGFLENQFGILPNQIGYNLKEDHVNDIDDDTRDLIEVRQHLFMAERFMLAEKYVKALEEYRVAAGIIEDDPVILLRKARALIELHQHDDAIPILDQLLEENPDSAESFLSRGQLYEVEEKYLKAAEVYEAGLEKHPQNILLLEAAASLSTKIDDIDSAIKYYEELTHIDGNNIFAFYILGRFYIKKANVIASQRRISDSEEEQRIAYLEKAAEKFNYAINLRDDVQDFYKYLGQIYERMGDKNKAHEVYSKALARFSSSREFQAFFEVSLGPGVSDEEKIQAYDKLVKQYSGNYALLRLYARTAVKLDRRDLALSLYQEMIDEDSTRLDPHLKMGELQIRYHRFNEAVDTFEHALLLDEDNIKIKQKLADVYFKTEKYTGAVRLYREMIKEEPKNNVHYTRLFECHLRLRNTQEAIRVLDELASVFGENQTIYGYKGNLYFQIGKLKESQAAYEKALEFDPDNDEIYYRLIPIYLLEANDAKLEWIIGQGNKHFKDNIEVLDLVLADSYSSTNRYKEAIEYYQKVLPSYKDKVSVYENLALCYYELDKKKQIKELLKQVKEQFTDDEFESARVSGFLYTQLGEFEKAESEFLRVLEIWEADKERSKNIRLRMRLERGLIDAQIELKKKDEVLSKLSALAENYLDYYADSILEMAFFACKDFNEFDFFNTIAERASSKKIFEGLAYYYLGSSAFEDGDLENAEKYYNKCIDSEPSYDIQANAMNAMGYMFAEKGIRLDEARELIERAYELRPLYGHIIDSLGWVYYQEGEYELAVELLEKAAMLSKPDSVIFDHLGDAHLKVGNVQEAISNWMTSIELDAENATAIRKKIQEAQKR